MANELRGMVTAPDADAAAQDVIKLSDVLRFVFGAKVFIIGGVLLGIALAALGSYLATPRYRAYVLMIRSEANQPGVEGLLSAGGFGGFAALAGIGGQVGRGDAEAEALLTSRETIGRFIDKHDVLPQLFPDEWDSEHRTWKPGKLSTEERRQRGIAYFKKSILNVNRERTTGLVTLSVEWRNRIETRDWANGIVALTNDLWREQVIKEAESSIQHLATELEKTSNLEVRDGIYRLTEAHMKQRALAVVRQDLLFKVLDPAMAPLPGEVVWPKPVLAIALSAIVGTVLGLLVAFLRLVWA